MTEQRGENSALRQKVEVRQPKRIADQHGERLWLEFGLNPEGEVTDRQRSHKRGCGIPRTGRRALRQRRGGSAMGLDDKVENTTQNTTGKVKEGVGKATDDEQLETEGKKDQAGASIKKAGEKIKDVFKS